MAHGVFVTGTDTSVGKTVASCALVHALREHGIEAHPFKPIAAGAVQRGRDWVNDDTVALAAAAGLDASAYADITPILLREAIAPHIAARHQGLILDLARVRDAFERISQRSPFIVAEGVGGFVVPLGERLDTVELCRVLGLPVVLVVGMRLGCLNHALLTARAVLDCGAGFAGWIANELDPRMDALDENIATLEQRLPGPLLGRFAHRVPPEPRALAAQLDLGKLFDALRR
jgi:dethiobiotin synthetase